MFIYNESTHHDRRVTASHASLHAGRFIGALYEFAVGDRGKVEVLRCSLKYFYNVLLESEATGEMLYMPSLAEIVQEAQLEEHREEEIEKLCKRVYEFAEHIIKCLMLPGLSPYSLLRFSCN